MKGLCTLEQYHTVVVVGLKKTFRTVPYVMFSSALLYAVLYCTVPYIPNTGPQL
jgi:hypothetical protein